MSTTIPNPNLTDGDDFSVVPLMANILALLTAIQSFDGSQIQDGTVSASALATGLNPLQRDYDMFESFVISGLLPSGYSVFNLTIPNGSAFVRFNNLFTRYLVAGANYTVSPNKDTYFTLKSDGTLDTPSALANNAALPTLSTGSQFLFRAVSDGSGIQRIDDLRNLTPVRKSSLQTIGAGSLSLNPIPTTWTDVPNSSKTFTISGNASLLINVSANDLQTNNSNYAQVGVMVDGVLQNDLIFQKNFGASGTWELHTAPGLSLAPIALTAGVHVIKLQAIANSVGVGALNSASWHGLVVPS